MTNDHDDLPDHLTFSQRYGYEPLPEPMKLEEISSDLRREIWNVIREFLLEKRSFSGNYYFRQNEARIIERVTGRLLRIAEDKVPTDYDKVMFDFEKACFSLSFNKLLEFLEAFVNDREVGDGFAESIRYLFEIHGAAYWLDSSRRTHRFVPGANKEQMEATRQAVETVGAKRRRAWCCDSLASSGRAPKRRPLSRFDQRKYPRCRIGCLQDRSWS